MTTWLITSQGGRFDFMNPTEEQITLRDITNGLANVCRWYGQIPRFYSVAEHCLHVAELVPVEHKFAALMHDAEEAYAPGDVPTPLKHHHVFADVLKLQQRVSQMIRYKFSLPAVDPPEVKWADRMMLILEQQSLAQLVADRRPTPDGFWAACGVTPEDLAQAAGLANRISYMSPQMARGAWSYAFEAYRGDAKCVCSRCDGAGVCGPWGDSDRDVSDASQCPVCRGAKLV